MRGNTELAHASCTLEGISRDSFDKVESSNGRKSGRGGSRVKPVVSLTRVLQVFDFQSGSRVFTCIV